MEWDRLLVYVVSPAERVIETTDERTWGGHGDSDVLITIRCHSDSEIGEQGFLDLSHSHVPATVTTGSMTTDFPQSHVCGPYVLAGVRQDTDGDNMTYIFLHGGQRDPGLSESPLVESVLSITFRT